MRVALAQIAPAWLQREATLEKITARLEEAAGQGAQLAVFGEALLPGYPFWPELTDGARFNSRSRWGGRPRAARSPASTIGRSISRGVATIAISWRSLRMPSKYMINCSLKKTTGSMEGRPMVDA